MTTPPSNDGPTPPPSRTGTRLDYGPIVDTLRRRPRTWALVFEAVTAARRGTLAHQAKQLEVVARNHREVNGKKVCDIYARWTPAKPVEAVS